MILNKALCIRVILWIRLLEFFLDKNWLSMHLVVLIIVLEPCRHHNRHCTLGLHIVLHVIAKAHLKCLSALCLWTSWHHWLNVVHGIHHIKLFISSHWSPTLMSSRPKLRSLSICIISCHCYWDFIRVDVFTMPRFHYNFVRNVKDTLVAGSKTHWLSSLHHSWATWLSTRFLITQMLFPDGLWNHQIDNSIISPIARKISRCFECNLFVFNLIFLFHLCFVN